MKSKQKSLDVRARVNHPIIDTDGHYSELFPVFRDYFLDFVKEVGGGQAAQQVLRHRDELYEYLVEQSAVGPVFPSRKWSRTSLEERRDNWVVQTAWAPMHRNTLDRATSYLPRLLHQRMDDLGIDFTVLYPGSGLMLPHLQHEELRRVACRAFNSLISETYREFSDRMTPAALIPMYTPEEAMDELDYALNELGLKVAMIGHVLRPVPSLHRERPDLFRLAHRVDAFGLDSEYDYDPFWRKCVELKVPVAAHQTTYGLGHRRSLSNYIYNQTTNFAEAGELLCKALFLGGVTRRFPTLKIQFLECGVGWATVLFAELVARWEKRSVGAIQENLELARRESNQLVQLMAEHGDARVQASLEEITGLLRQQLEAPHYADDWAACEIEKAEDVRDLFIPNFYFGCEADDAVTAWAFNAKANPFGAHLRATLGSDLGHWDVNDAQKVVAEAYELVERGLMSDEDFRDFTFTNPVTFCAGLNRSFFENTPVEAHAAALLKDSE